MPPGGVIKLKTGNMKDAAYSVKLWSESKLRNLIESNENNIALSHQIQVLWLIT
jgi:hypothetical protein